MPFQRRRDTRRRQRLSRQVLRSQACARDPAAAAAAPLRTGGARGRQCHRRKGWLSPCRRLLAEAKPPAIPSSPFAALPGSERGVPPRWCLHELPESNSGREEFWSLAGEDVRRESQWKLHREPGGRQACARPLERLRDGCDLLAREFACVRSMAIALR